MLAGGCKSSRSVLLGIEEWMRTPFMTRIVAAVNCSSVSNERLLGQNGRANYDHLNTKNDRICLFQDLKINNAAQVLTSYTRANPRP